MKQTKTYADLLRKLFSDYKNGNPAKEFEAYQNIHDVCRVLPLSVEHCLPWASFSLILKQYSTDAEALELSLSAKTPRPGHNEEIYGQVFTIHSTLSGRSHLWAIPNRSLGGISHVIPFEKDSAIINDLIIDIMQRVQKLLATGLYGVNPVTVAQQH